jgi:hypothetical protein
MLRRLQALRHRVLFAPLSLLGMLLTVLPGGREARAQCAGSGVVVGTCSDDRGFEGCCADPSTVSWCEGNNLCQIDCATNAQVPTRSCCEVSETAGCCDAGIEACVCRIDDLCCDDLWGFGWDIFCVDIAVSQCGGCSGETCAEPPTSCAWNGGGGFYDCGAAYTPEPTGTEPAMCPGASCSPQCSGRECGGDGCGGVCGVCPSGFTCNGLGLCQSNGCTPQCVGRQCGADGCGGSCGPCNANQICDTDGQCRDVACVPQCDGRQCGADGCGGVCGACGPNETCQPDGTCRSSVCAPQCRGRECGGDGCGGVCGTCAGGAECVSGLCILACQPDCTGRTCGDDGCGGSCGECGGDAACVDGRCQARCSCQGRECGDDGCGRICGFCGPGNLCEPLTQKCVAEAIADPAPQNVFETDTSPRACPTGQIWSPYTGTCVVDPAHGRDGSDGCAGGAGGLGGFGLLGLAGFLARRARRRS